MELNRNGLVAKLYFFTLGYEKLDTDLCSVMRRIVVVLPLQILIVLVVSAGMSAFVFWVFIPAIVFLAFLSWDNPYYAFVFLLFSALVLVLTLSAADLTLPQSIIRGWIGGSEICTVLREWFKAKKNKYCPKVTFR